MVLCRGAIKQNKPFLSFNSAMIAQCSNDSFVVSNDNKR